jgi:RNA polymerase sigma-70 factor (ECF subfamily)
LRIHFLESDCDRPEEVLTPPDQCRIDPAEVAALYIEHADQLRAFLWGVLRDADLVGDVLQATFVKAIELGHTAQEQSLKGWLFQVAYREALVIRRREAVHDRAVRRLADAGSAATETPDGIACRRETIDEVRRALEKLPAEQRRVVLLRMVDGKKFAKIAGELNLPLGTVLTRMQLALARLRTALKGK